MNMATNTNMHFNIHFNLETEIGTKMEMIWAEASK